MVSNTCLTYLEIQLSFNQNNIKARSCNFCFHYILFRNITSVKLTMEVHPLAYMMRGGGVSVFCDSCFFVYSYVAYFFPYIYICKTLKIS